jgi:hypothetical protein
MESPRRHLLLVLTDRLRTTRRDKDCYAATGAGAPSTVAPAGPSSVGVKRPAVAVSLSVDTAGIDHDQLMGLIISGKYQGDVDTGAAIRSTATLRIAHCTCGAVKGGGFIRHSRKPRIIVLVAEPSHQCLVLNFTCPLSICCLEETCHVLS